LIDDNTLVSKVFNPITLEYLILPAINISQLAIAVGQHMAL
jgi:hypothetical protein